MLLKMLISAAGRGVALPRVSRHVRQPSFERFETRTLLTLDFTSAAGLAASFASPPHVAVDVAGNIYETGSFVGAANLDPSMTSAGALSTGATVPATFVARYSPSGSLLWAIQFASLSSGTPGAGSAGTGIAVDSNTGAIDVIGRFQGQVNFNPGGSPLDVTSSSATMADAYVVQLTPAGTVVPGLVKTYGNGTGSPEFNALALSGDGSHVDITGAFTGAVNFDPGGTNTTLTSPTDGDAFVLALSGSLGFAFVKEPNLDSAEGTGIAIDATGSVSIAGDVSASQDMFLARFDASGNPAGARLFLGTHSPASAAQASALVSDGTNLYLAGTFRGNEVNFNATTGTPAFTLDSRGQSDAFVLKLDARLDMVWALRFGSPNADSGTALAFDGRDRLYLSGWVSGQASIGTTGLGTVIFAPGNGLSATPDTFVLGLDTNGNAVDPPVGPTGSGTSSTTSIAANPAGLVVQVGIYGPPILFGGTLLQAPGTSVPFLVTLLHSEGTGPGTGGGGSGSGTGEGGGGGGIVTLPPSPVPVFLGARGIPAANARGRRKSIVAIQLVFSAPLDAGVAANLAHYRVTQPGRTRRTLHKLVPVLAATVSTSATMVTLLLGKHDQTRPLSFTAVNLVAADETPVMTIAGRV